MNLDTVRAKALSELDMVGTGLQRKLKASVGNLTRLCLKIRSLRNRGGGCDSTAKGLPSTYKALAGLSSQHHMQHLEVGDSSVSSSNCRGLTT